MRYRERILYILMFVSSTSWLICLVTMSGFENKYEWIGIMSIVIAILGFIATLSFSIFIMAVGPKKARFAVLKWILVFLPSGATFSHGVPGWGWVPIIFSIASVALPARWLDIEWNSEVKGNVST